MRYRRLGSSDLEVSEISLGSWLTYGGGVGRKQTEACVARAFDVGITFFDTANVYARGGAESLLGGILAGRPRDSFVLATKLYFPVNGDRGLSREQVLKQIDLSLGRLRPSPETRLEEPAFRRRRKAAGARAKFGRSPSDWEPCPEPPRVTTSTRPGNADGRARLPPGMHQPSQRHHHR